MRTQLGFSLSELLISLFLTSLIMTLLFAFYLSTKRQYMETQAVLSRNFEQQWVADLLTDSVRRAGFTPCLGVDYLKRVDRRRPGRDLAGLRVTNHPRKLLEINHMNEHFYTPLKIGSSQILLAKTAVFNEKRPLIIADCQHAEVHEVALVEKTGRGLLLTLAKPLLFTYTSISYVGEWLEENWFIKQTASGKNVLYYKLVHSEELSPLIHALDVVDRRQAPEGVVEINLGIAENKIQRLIIAVRSV